MNLKRITASVAAAVMATSIAASAQTIEKISVNGINVVLNDQQYTGINLLYNDRTYVPLRDIAESIGCTVEYDDATATATITSNGEVQFPEELVSSYGSYDEEYAALKSEYDMLISYQNSLASQTDDADEKSKLEEEAARLSAEFEAKAADLEQKYANMTQTVPVAQEQDLAVDLNAITVIVNGTQITEPNILYNDRTYVPFRAVFETLGCVVGWNEVTQTASITGFFSESSETEEVYTSFEEEYAQYVERYEKLIAEQEELGQQAYDETIKQSTGATGAQEGGQVQLAEAAREPYLIRAEELRQELADHEARLKEKYGVTE